MNMNDPNALSNFREFLETYQRIGEACFNSCVFLSSRSLTGEELSCVDRCTTKHMRTNHKILSAFLVEQPLMMEKKMAAAEKETAELQAKMAAEGKDAPKSVTPEEHAQMMMQNMQQQTPNAAEAQS